MDPFDEASAAFVAWLKSSGADVSDKIELKDLRNMEAGRGVGTLLCCLPPRGSFMSSPPAFAFCICDRSQIELD